MMNQIKLQLRRDFLFFICVLLFSKVISLKTSLNLSFHSYSNRKSTKELKAATFPKVTFQHWHPTIRGSRFWVRKYAGSLANAEISDENIDYTIDPNSEEAVGIITSLGLSPEQQDKLISLSNLIIEWNEHINLISRVNCTKEVVFGRHIIPSVALVPLIEEHFSLPHQTTENENASHVSGREKLKAHSPRIIDVGTGGGFPGLPLAIAFPHFEFLLVDSVGKKLKVVDAIADELGLSNVKTHHGRVEEIIVGSHGISPFDIVLGRSVAGLPKFCFWVQHLLSIPAPADDNRGKLFYIVGGDIEEFVLDRCERDVLLNDLTQSNLDGYKKYSDKRVLIFDVTQVKEIADLSGEKSRKSPQQKKKKTNDKIGQANKGNSFNRNGKFETAKGKWSRKNDGSPKDRGYQDFKRSKF